MSTASTKILTKSEQGIGSITFNNPERHNAMSLDMWKGLADALIQFKQDQSIRVVIMTGAGEKAFVSGADISEFEKKRASQEQRGGYEKVFDLALGELSTFDKPLIAMITGY